MIYYCSMDKIKQWSDRVRDQVGTVFYGKNEVLEKILTAVLCRGHILVEDVPGVGKTILSRALALALGGKFNRIQCTPDLLPSDILGVSMYNQQSNCFHFNPGPVFTNILLVDEINRSTPRTQSAFLEAMGEAQVSVEGKARLLPDPFLVLATENPVEFEGTYSLPEAQKDRFFVSLQVGYPDRAAEMQMLDKWSGIDTPIEKVESVSSLDEVLVMQKQAGEVFVSPALKNYILDLVRATREDSRFSLGASPRAALALIKGSRALAAIRGRDFAAPEDVIDLTIPVFRQRLVLKASDKIRGIGVDEAIESIVRNIPVPGT